MPTPPRRRPTIPQRTDETADESGLDEAATLLVEHYPDLDSAIDSQVEQGPHDAFAQKARVLFKTRMRGN
jgi:hypothetical protein